MGCHGGRGKTPQSRIGGPGWLGAVSRTLGRHVHLNPALARAAQDVGVHSAGKCSVGLGRVAHVGSGRTPLDRGVGHHAVPLEIADLRPGRAIPGELNRLRNSRVARRRAADDRGDALSARPARAKPIGLGVPHLGSPAAMLVPDFGPTMNVIAYWPFQDGVSAEAVAGSDRAIVSGAAHKQTRPLRRTGAIDLLLSARNGFGTRMRRGNLGSIPMNRVPSTGR